jgi:hypothetical protein
MAVATAQPNQLLQSQAPQILEEVAVVVIMHQVRMVLLAAQVLSSSLS